MKKNNFKFMFLVALVIGLLYFVNTSYESTNIKTALASAQDGIPYIGQNFKLEILSFDQQPQYGKELDINVQITNEGEEGYMYIECGIYPSDTPWLPSIKKGYYIGNILTHVDNCHAGETNVYTRKLILTNGQKFTREWHPIMPSQQGTYSVFCHSFRNCWDEDCQDLSCLGESDWDLVTVGNTQITGDGDSDDDYDNSLDNVVPNNQPLLHYSDVQKATADSLILSSCTLSSQCEEGGTCTSLAYLKEKGYLTSTTENNLVGKLKTSIKGGVIGGTLAGLTCVGIGVASIAGCGPCAIIPLSVCATAVTGSGAIIGSGVGFLASDWANHVKEGDLSKGGVCIDEESSGSFCWEPANSLLGKMFNDNCQTSTLVLIIGIFMLFMILMASMK